MGLLAVILLVPLFSNDRVPIQRRPASDNLPANPCNETEFSLEPGIEYVNHPAAVSGSEKRNFVNVKRFNGFFDMENIGRIENVGEEGAQARLVSRQIDEVLNFSNGPININSVQIEKILEQKTGRMNLIVGQIKSIESIRGEVCGSVGKIEKIDRIHGVMSLWGRDQHKLDFLGSANGVIYLTNFDVQEVKAQVLHAQFSRSRVRKVSSGTGVIVLEDTVIEDLQEFTGQIFLKGNSTIDHIAPTFSGAILRD